MIKSILASSILSLTLVLSLPISTQAFRCGSEIVSRWDTAAETLTKCGQPFQKNWEYQNINGQKLYVEKWFYNCGDNDFIYSISIYNGKIVSIDSVQRGKGKGQCK